jgi:uncharacterized MnhB-related membrane protein
VLQAVALTLVLAGGTSVALTREPLRQVLLLGLYGGALTILFFVLQAPDVALSEIVVGPIAMPLIVLAALRKIGEQERERRASEAEDDR